MCQPKGAAASSNNPEPLTRLGRFYRTSMDGYPFNVVACMQFPNNISPIRGCTGVPPPIQFLLAFVPPVGHSVTETSGGRFRHANQAKNGDIQGALSGRL